MSVFASSNLIPFYNLKAIKELHVLFAPAELVFCFNLIPRVVTRGYDLFAPQELVMFFNIHVLKMIMSFFYR
jgi:hypothetical protein